MKNLMILAALIAAIATAAYAASVVTEVLAPITRALARP